MKKKSDNIVLVEKAFSLYCQGESLLAISKLCGINRHTVERYEKQFDWQKQRSGIIEKIRAKRDETIFENIDEIQKELDEMDTKLKKFMDQEEPESYAVAMHGRLKIAKLQIEINRQYDYFLAIHRVAMHFVQDTYFNHPVIKKALQDNKLSAYDVTQYIIELMNRQDYKERLQKEHTEAKRKDRL